MVKIQNLNKGWIVLTLLFLLLVLFFYQSNVFRQLFKTIWGRSFLVLLVVYITYCNQILGYLFVLFLIILSNRPIHSMGGMFEGYTYKIKDEKKKNQTSISTPTPSTSTTVKKESDSKALEGFDLYGLEDNMKKGKQSNSVPVNGVNNDSSNVSAYDENIFHTPLM